MTAVNVCPGKTPASSRVFASFLMAGPSSKWDRELDKFGVDALAPELQELTPTITSLLRPRCEDQSKFVSSLKASMTNASKECSDAWYKLLGS